MPYYTHYKNNGDHHCVCVDDLSVCCLQWMPYYTHHKHKGAHHYECVDALSDCSFDQMPYYTHHTYKGTHHYVCVDAVSDCPYDSIPYYILHINTDAHPSVHHRNICIWECVGEVVHSEYPCKKKKKVNVRIYSDRKNSYFHSNVIANKNPLCLKNCVIHNNVLDD